MDCNLKERADKRRVGKWAVWWDYQSNYKIKKENNQKNSKT